MRVVEKNSKAGPTPRLGSALSAFYASQDKTDWSGIFTAAELGASETEASDAYHSQVEIALDQGTWRVKETAINKGSREVHDGAMTCSGATVVIVLKDRLLGSPKLITASRQGNGGYEGVSTAAYLRSRHRRPERNFEVVAGKVLNLDGSQHRFAFARNGDSANEFAEALATAGVRTGTPATVLSDGDAGLWKLQRQVMPEATLVLDWWHIAMRFEHALQAARGLGANTPAGHLRGYAVRDLEGAKWLLWHGRSSSCLGRLAKLAGWFGASHVRDTRARSRAKSTPVS